MADDVTVAQVFAHRYAIELTLTSRISAALRSLGRWMIDEFDLKDRSIVAAAPLSPEGLSAVIARWAVEVNTKIQPAMLAAFGAQWDWNGARFVETITTLGIDPAAILGPNVRDVRASEMFKSAKPRIDRVGTEIWDEMTTVLRKSFDQGASTSDIAKALREEVGTRLVGKRGLTPARAQTIARTETAAIVGGADYSMNQEMKSAGLETRRTWQATTSSSSTSLPRKAASVARTRPTHRRASGEAEQDGYFYVGGARLRYPGDPNGPAGETINCRCCTLLELADDPVEEAPAEEAPAEETTTTAAFGVGDQVTRKGSNKVWEIASVRSVSTLDPYRQEHYGGPDAWVYKLKNPGTANSGLSWWKEDQIKRDSPAEGTTTELKPVALAPHGVPPGRYTVTERDGSETPVSVAVSKSGKVTVKITVGGVEMKAPLLTANAVLKKIAAQLRD